MQTYKILILEDDFEAVSKIMAELYNLEGFAKDIMEEIKGILNS